MSCPGCAPWNAPLHFTAIPLMNGGSVGLTYVQWLVYHWHVAMHQADNWGGQINEFDGDIMKFVQKAA